MRPTLFPHLHFLLALVAGFVFPTVTAAASLIEAESVYDTKRYQGSDGTPDRKLTAFGGACLGNGWGQAGGNWAEYSVQSEGGAATLHLRYARHPISGQRRWSERFTLKAKIGTQEATIELPFTGDWELWRWVQVPLGEVAAGPHTLRLEALNENAPVNIDALMLAPVNQTPPEVARPLLFDGSRHLRIQLSPSMKSLESDRLFAMGELRGRSDANLIRRYRVLLRNESAEAKTRFENFTPQERDAWVIERLGQAMGQDLRPAFLQWGFQLPQSLK